MKHFLSRSLRLMRESRLPHFQTHITNAVKAFRLRPWRSFDMITVLSEKPRVIYTGCHPRKLARYLQPKLASDDLTIFYRAGWSMEHEPSFQDRVAAIKYAQARFPRHRYIFAANTPHEAERFTRAGLRAEFLNENAFIDEFCFQPDDSIEKKYHAVLDAQIAPYKRLELAARIPKLAVVTFILPDRFDPIYSDRVRQALAHAVWANAPYWESSYRKLNRAEISHVYRQARVGLSLSEMEGANLASIQYLLAGLPVVSTPSRGGRDVFFSDEYAEVVSPEASAIADAVEKFVRTGPPPATVREKVLAKIWPIRRCFAEILCAELGHPEIDEAWWFNFNSKNPIRYQDLRKMAAMFAPARRVH